MPPSYWSRLKELRLSLESLRLEMLSLEKDSLQGIPQVHPANQSSARNLLHSGVMIFENYRSNSRVWACPPSDALNHTFSAPYAR